MSNFKFDIKTAKENLKYIEKRIKNATTEKESLELKEVQLFFILMIERFESKGIKFFKGMIDNLLNGNFKLKRELKKGRIAKEVIENGKGNINENEFSKDYLKFLLKIVGNLDEVRENFIFNFDNFDKTDKEKVEIVTKFYQSLNNDEIFEKFQKALKNLVIEKENSVNSGGYCFPSTFLSDPIPTVYRSDTMLDVNLIAHELMHSINLLFGENYKDKYVGFEEVPAITIEYLMIDFLKKQDYTKGQENEIYKHNQFDLVLKNMKVEDLIKKRLTKREKIGEIKGGPFDDDAIFEEITSNEKKLLLNIQSHVVAKIFAEQIKKDKEQGLNNLINFMKKGLPIGKDPDFVEYGIYEENILYTSGNMFAKPGSGRII